MKPFFVRLIFLLTMSSLCIPDAEAGQPSTPQLVYPSTRRVVIFVADG